MDIHWTTYVCTGNQNSINLYVWHKNNLIKTIRKETFKQTKWYLHTLHNNINRLQNLWGQSNTLFGTSTVLDKMKNIKKPCTHIHIHKTNRPKKERHIHAHEYRDIQSNYHLKFINTWKTWINSYVGKNRQTPAHIWIPKKYTHAHIRAYTYKHKFTHKHTDI